MRDPIDEIKGIGQNDFNLRQLLLQLRSPLGVVPFVGAGLSIPFRFKGWQAFLLTQAAAANIDSKIRDRIRKGEYEEAAEDLLKEMAPLAFQDALLEEYGPWKLEGVKLNGTVSLLPQLSRGPVVTTNFDRVLETVFEDSGERFERIVWGANLPQATQAVQQNKRCLLKLHGDVEDRTDRVLTLTEYQRHYGTAEPTQNTFKEDVPNLLRLLLISRPVLFLGCSLKNDRVIKLLRRVAEQYPDLVHYAVVESSVPEAFAETRRYFSEHQIRPIWYPRGKHEFVESIVRYLAEEVGRRPFDHHNQSWVESTRDNVANRQFRQPQLGGNGHTQASALNSEIDSSSVRGSIAGPERHTEAQSRSASSFSAETRDDLGNDRDTDLSTNDSFLKPISSAMQHGDGVAPKEISPKDDHTLDVHDLLAEANKEYSARRYGQARDLFLQAARFGNGEAMYNLGIIHQFGPGAPQDLRQARRWYLKSARRQISAAMNAIGLMYEHGDGTPQDRVKAARWYRRALKSGNPQAAFNIRNLHLTSDLLGTYR